MTPAPRSGQEFLNRSLWEHVAQRPALPLPFVPGHLSSPLCCQNQLRQFCRIEMAKRGSQGVGRIFTHRQPERLRVFTAAEEREDGFLHLQFFRSPVADHCRFDFRWIVFSDTQTRLRGGQQCDATRLTQTQGTLHIVREKSFFQTEHVRSPGVDHVNQTGMDDP